MALTLSSPAVPVPMDHADHARRVIAVRLLPFLFILYIANYLDRTNVAYAALGMSRDLGFSDSVLGLGSGIFFISYLALQIPGALLVEHWSARRMISVTMIAWGSLTALTGLVHTPNQLYAARFLLGGAEAGFFPGVIVYLSHWFIQEDRAKATSNFMGAIPLSFVIGSPIAGWILGHPWLHIQGWRWLFFLEGIPAVLLGAVAFFFLTDFPREAAWLPAPQRQWIEQTLNEESAAGAKSTSVWETIKSPAILMMAFLTFPCYFMNYSFYFWFPTMLKSQSGFSDVRVGLVGAVPYAVAFIAMQVNGWHSDKHLERRWHSAVPMFLAAAGVMGLIVPLRSTPITMLFFCIASLSTAYLPAFWAIPTEILTRTSAATAVGIINSVGSLAGFAGPYLLGYLQTRTGSFSYGLFLMMVAALTGGFLILRIPDKRRPIG